MTTTVATPCAPRPEAVQPWRGQGGGGETEALRTFRLNAMHGNLMVDAIGFLRLRLSRRVQPLDTENRTSSGVGGCRGAIPGTRPDRGTSQRNSIRAHVIERTAVLGCDVGAVREPPVTEDHEAEQGTSAGLRRYFSSPPTGERDCR